jgi:hypothetical protein
LCVEPLSVFCAQRALGFYPAWLRYFLKSQV